MLPEVTFDIAQNGILECGREAEAMYKVLVINKAYSGLWSALIKQTLSNYDVERLKIKDEVTGGRSFCDLLALMQEESSVAFRIIVDACNLKLSELKTKKDLKLYLDFSKMENVHLRELKLKIIQNCNSYIDAINNETIRARREVKREEQRQEEARIIEASPVGILYRILNLSSRDIPDVPFNQMNRFADELAMYIELEEKLQFFPSVVADIKRKLKRRAYREFLYRYKTKLKEAFRNNEIVDFNLKFDAPPSANLE